MGFVAGLLLVPNCVPTTAPAAGFTPDGTIGMVGKNAEGGALFGMEGGTDNGGFDSAEGMIGGCDGTIGGITVGVGKTGGTEIEGGVTGAGGITGVDTPGKGM